MKKVRKSPMIPQALTDYVVANPNADWEDFRNETANGYAVVKQQLTADQRGLCAYCEIDLHIHAQNGLDDFRVEHFHPKKPHNPPPNHALEWQNLLAVCTGGNIRDLEIRERFTSLYQLFYRYSLVFRRSGGTTFKNYWLRWIMNHDNPN